MNYTVNTNEAQEQVLSYVLKRRNLEEGVSLTVTDLIEEYISHIVTLNVEAAEQARRDELIAAFENAEPGAQQAVRSVLGL